MLDIFAQSLLDTGDLISLTDFVNGMNLSEDWGKETLDLASLSDAAWVQWKHDKIMADRRRKTPGEMTDDDYVASGFQRRQIWEENTRGKQHRCGVKHPTELYSTLFRFHNDPDPRTMDRPMA